MKRNIIPKRKKYIFKAIRRPGGSECWPLNETIIAISVQEACYLFGCGMEYSISAQYEKMKKSEHDQQVTFIGSRPLISKFIEAEYGIYEERD